MTLEENNDIEVRELTEEAAKDVVRDVMYDRNRDLYDQDSVGRAHVVGCGGIGSWVGMSLALAGCRELHLYDDDILELHNLNRLPYTEEDVGKPKTEALKDLVARLRPECEVVVHGRIEEEGDIEVENEDERVVICVDSASANNLVLRAVEGTLDGQQVIRAAYDGDSLSVMDACHQWDEGPGGYGVDPSYVAPPMVAASLVVEKAYRDPGLEVHSRKVSELGRE